GVLEKDVGAAVTDVVGGADRAPAGSRIAEAAAADPARSVQLPDIDLAAGVLKQDVGVAVDGEVARSLGVPARSGIAETAAADLGGPAEFPDIAFAAGVLEQDVGIAVGIEITGRRPGNRQTQLVPARARIAETAAGDDIGPTEFPDVALAGAVL